MILRKRFSTCFWLALLTILAMLGYFSYHIGDSRSSELKHCVSFCVFDRRTCFLAMDLISFMHSHLYNKTNYKEDRVKITYKLHHFDELSDLEIAQCSAIFSTYRLEDAFLKIENLNQSFSAKYPGDFMQSNRIPENFYQGYLCKPLGLLLSDCDVEVMMDYDVLPLYHPFALLHTEQYLSTGLFVFNHADMEYCTTRMSTCVESLIKTYPEHVLTLISQYSLNFEASMSIIQKTQFYNLLSHGHESSMMAINRVKVMPTISRSLETLLTNFGAREILLGNASSDMGLFSRPAASMGDCEVLPLSFVLSGIDYGRSQWLCLWMQGTGQCWPGIVMHQFNPLFSDIPRLFYMQGPYIETFKGKEDAWCLKDWLDPNHRFARITSYVTKVSHTNALDRVKVNFTTKYSSRDMQYINLYYELVWQYPGRYFP